MMPFIGIRTQLESALQSAPPQAAGVPRPLYSGAIGEMVEICERPSKGDQND
jgi:hypothetical protein